MIGIADLDTRALTKRLRETGCLVRVLNLKTRGSCGSCSLNKSCGLGGRAGEGPRSKGASGRCAKRVLQGKGAAWASMLTCMRAHALVRVHTHTHTHTHTHAHVQPCRAHQVGAICTDASKSDAELVEMAKNWTIVGKDLLSVVRGRARGWGGVGGGVWGGAGWGVAWPSAGRVGRLRVAIGACGQQVGEAVVAVWRWGEVWAGAPHRLFRATRRNVGRCERLVQRAGAPKQAVLGHVSV